MQISDKDSSITICLWPEVSSLLGNFPRVGLPGKRPDWRGHCCAWVCWRYEGCHHTAWFSLHCRSEEARGCYEQCLPASSPLRTGDLPWSVQENSQLSPDTRPRSLHSRPEPRYQESRVGPAGVGRVRGRDSVGAENCKSLALRRPCRGAQWSSVRDRGREVRAGGYQQPSPVSE